MKWSLFLNEDALQFNLTCENEHECQLIHILKKYTGNVSIYEGADIALTQGNYLRNFGEKSKTVAVTIRKPEIKDDTASSD